MCSCEAQEKAKTEAYYNIREGLFFRGNEAGVHFSTVL